MCRRSAACTHLVASFPTAHAVGSGLMPLRGRIQTPPQRSGATLDTTAQAGCMISVATAAAERRHPERHGRPMIGFQISVNGKLLYTVGVGEFGLLNAFVNRACWPQGKGDENNRTWVQAHARKGHDASA